MTARSRQPKLTSRQRRRRYTVRKLTPFALLVMIISGLVFADSMGLFGFADRPDMEKYDGRSFKVVNVVDGDTLYINIPDGKYDTTRIRLLGVDTPETVKPKSPQHFGQEASEFVTKLCLDKTVTLRLEPASTRDKYHRLLAYIVLEDGRMLNRILVEQGYAYADPRFSHSLKSEFLAIQKQAKADRVGLWKDVTNADLPHYYHDKLRLP